ncbi:MAG: PIN domain-like protein [Piptocephalis tieghemiana]|nr:MAG: PIN domain-like protein [Piptocephalis tieghemiana]
MGILKLTPLMHRFAPKSLELVPLNRYRGTNIAVDGHLFLHRAMYAPIPHPYSHLAGILSLCRTLLHYEIRPIFVFDGQTRLPGKERERDRRSRLKAAAQQELELTIKRQERLEQLGALIREIGMHEKRKIQVSKPTQTILKPVIQGFWPEYKTIGSKVQIPDSSQGLNALGSREKRWAERLKDLALQAIAYVKPLHAPGLSKGERWLEQQEILLLARFASPKTLERLEELKMSSHNIRLALEVRTQVLKEDYLLQVREMLRLLGIPAFSSEDHEAEAMCSALVREGYAMATLSEDTDVLAFGDGPLLRNIRNPAHPTQVLEMRGDVARKALGLTRDSWIDMCILCGTDFSSTIENVGYIRAVQYIQEHGSIEALLAAQPKLKPRMGFVPDQAREIFNRSPTFPPNLSEVLQPKPEKSREMEGFVRDYQLEEFNVCEDLAMQGPGLGSESTITSHADMRKWMDQTGRGPEGLGPDPFSQPG